MKKDFSITLLSNFIILFLNIISGIIIARALGPTGKGILRTLVIWPTLLSQIAIMGMHESYIYLKNRDYNTLKLKSSILFGVLLSSIFISVPLYLLYVLLFKHIYKSIYLLLLIIIYIPVANVIQVGLCFLQERMAFLKYNLLRLLFSLFYIALLLIDYDQLTPQKCFIYLFVSNVVLLLVILSEYKELSAKYLSKVYLKDSFSFGIKTQLASIIGAFSQQIDQAILSLISTPQTLGIYSVAVSISRIGALAPYTAQVVLYPKMSKEKRYSIRKSIIFLFAINLILYVVLFSILHKLIILFYGAQFESATQIALLLFAVSFPLSILYVGDAYFKSKGNPTKIAIAQGIVFILLLILTPLLYLVNGTFGVGYASLISYSIGAIYYIINFRKNGDSK